MRRLLVLLVLVAVTGGCNASGPRPEEVVFLDNGDELAAVQPDTGDTPFRIGGARAATPDWHHIFSATEGPGGPVEGPAGTVLSLVDARTGSSGGWARYLEGGLEPRVASNDLSVVLMPRRKDPSAYAPEGRERTTLVVARAGRDDVQRLDLAGNYEPEAFSTDGSRLFVIEYRPPTHPEVYSVRQLDLASGTISPVPSRDKELQEDMRGTARTQAMAPDGKRLYTLYNLEMQHPDGTVHKHAFVHVLDLEEGWAHCVDLPASFVSSSETASALTVSSDGRRVYVANRQAGELAEVDTVTVSLRRAIPIRLAPDETLTAAASERGLFLGTGQRVVALDPALRRTGEWRFDRMVAGVQPSGDGRHLYVSTRGRLVVVDLQGGKTQTTTVMPGQLRGIGLLPLAVNSVECAC